MTWYADLAPCGPGLLAVGWLEKEYAYTRGPVPEDVYDRLVTLLVDPWQPIVAMGYHDCSLCQRARGPHTITHKGTTITTGASNLFLPGQRCIYIAPSLIVHYIAAHDYALPQEFSNAVMACPPMGSAEYLHAISRNGGADLMF